MLEIIDLTQSLDKTTYRSELDRCQTWMRMLGYHLYYQKRPAVIVFEGWDAAGKGGAINRLTERLDPRAFVVHPIAAPRGDDAEKHYLWRFWRRLPERVPDQVGLLVGREGEIDDLDRRVLDQSLRRVVDLADAPALRDLRGPVAAPRRDCDHREAGLLVGGEVALRHDHAGTDAADPEVAAANRRVRREAPCVRHDGSSPCPFRPSRRPHAREDAGRQVPVGGTGPLGGSFRRYPPPDLAGPLLPADDQYSFTLSTHPSSSVQPPVHRPAPRIAWNGCKIQGVERPARVGHKDGGQRHEKIQPITK